mmetsp:Transcript_24631/g.37329  ORF Transcript_24631/g.37329 Transcript_24631/m.37329 type:complete len:197 (-) Transcript_24631:458-1048(-)
MTLVRANRNSASSVNQTMHRGRLLRHTVLTILIFFPFTYMLFLFKRTSSSINTSTSSDALRKSNAHQLSNVQAPDQKKVVRKTNAFRCKSKKSIDDGMLMSQSEEDEELLYVYGFDQICGGTYLEMGGLDGRMFSNSYVFHKALDWKGVLVEASPSNYAKMIEERPNEIAMSMQAFVAKKKICTGLKRRDLLLMGF